MNLQEFVMRIEEGRPRKNVEGKPAEKNGSGGLYGIDEPVSDKAVVDIPQEQLNKNMKKLLMKFRTEEDFFIIGKAGWGKTSIIRKLADQFGRKVETVYLDKAVASDLGGIPVPGKTKKGHGKQEMLMPDWAAKMDENPDVDYLLFFDEMNQAAPDVMNALMPIVLEHEVCRTPFENFFVGAAGNFEDENDAVNELSGPLRSRFKPLITWQTDWSAAFSHLHSKWDDILGKEFISKFEENKELFDNPREIERNIFKFTSKLKKSGMYSEFDVDDYLDRITDIIGEKKLSRSEESAAKKLAEYMYDYINDKLAAKAEKSSRSTRNKGMDMVSEVTKNAIRKAMRQGYLEQKEGKDQHVVRYGISRENISAIIDPEECNAEMLERIITKLEADGVKFKFEKDSQWKKLGYKDPMSEDDD